MSWRYIAAHLDGDGGLEFVDFDVPLTDVKIEDVVSGDNSLTGKIAPEYARLKDDNGRPLFKRWKTAIFAESDGDIRGGGILQHSSLNGPELDLECVGYTGYAQDMPWTTNGVHYEKTDAADIFRNVWNHLQGRPRGNLGLQVGDHMSKVMVGDRLKQIEFDTENGPVVWEKGEYKLNRYTSHNLSDNLSELALIGRFDWAEKHSWDGDTIRHDLILGKIGNRRENLRFMIGENVDVIPNVEQDGELYADEVLVLGAGEGSAQKYGLARRNADGLRRVLTIVDSDLRSDARCATRANTEVAWRNDIDEINNIVLRNHPHAAPGVVQAGDEIWIEGDLGWTYLETWVKVISRTISPDDGDSVELEVVRTSRLAG